MPSAAPVATPAEGLPTFCHHCGEPCDSAPATSSHGTFCCEGCEAVFAVLQARNLDAFYSCEIAPGVSQKYKAGLDGARFAALDDPHVAGHLVEFDDGRIAVATFSIPTIHCASCVWLLEQLWRFEPGTTRAEVDLQRRSLRVEYRPGDTSPRRIAEQLAALGYEPLLSIEGTPAPARSARRRLYLQLGVAGFAFGNIMLFSIPRYANGAPLDREFQSLFGVLNVLLALPVLLFSASDYFRIAWHAVRRATMALEVPVALGLAVLFTRSVVEMASARGEGFMDSFAGLVFFLLLGRLAQQKVFDRIAFDRTFRSFLPLSVRVDHGGGAIVVPLERVRPGDCIAIRRGEVVPADARLLDEDAVVDYGFITGEQTPIALRRGDTVRAGGRAAVAMRLCVLRDVSHSQLATFWNNSIFSKVKSRWLADVAVRFGAWFTVGAIGLAIAGAIAWWPDAAASASVATAVLIVACPCALTLSAPITLGTAMGELARRGLYLKQPAVALDLSRIDMVVFDKTGTLTAGSARTVVERNGLSDRGWGLVRHLALESVHPASRAIASHFPFPSDRLPRPSDVRETPGQGISGIVGGERVAIGSAAFIATYSGRPRGADDRTYVVAGDERGWVRFGAAARPGIEQATETLAGHHDISLLSGDHGGDRSRWSRLFGRRMRFRQSPGDKLAFVTDAQAGGRHVLMVGDGLNDAGALAAADVGLAVSDDTACVVPACDAVISGHRLADLPAFLRFARRARQVVVACFVVSVAYNAIGLTLALSGALTPLASAILMPVSSLTVVALSAGAVRWSARRMLPA
jgi:Cu+-exporting ATPase